MFTNDIYYGWQWMGQQWERSLFCQFQLLGSYWKVHWLKLAPGLKKVQWGKPTPPNIFFRPILPNFEKRIEIRDDDFGGWSMLPVRKTALRSHIWRWRSLIWRWRPPPWSKPSLLFSTAPIFIFFWPNSGMESPVSNLTAFIFYQFSTDLWYGDTCFCIEPALVWTKLFTLGMVKTLKSLVSYVLALQVL